MSRYCVSCDLVKADDQFNGDACISCNPCIRDVKPRREKVIPRPRPRKPTARQVEAAHKAITASRAAKKKSDPEDPPSADDIAEALAFFRDKPVAFCEKVLRFKPHRWQKEAFDGLMKKKRLAVRSCHGVGKSHFVAALVLWVLTTRPEVVIAITAPTFRQVTNVVFRTVEKVLSGALPDFQALVKWTPTRVEFGKSFALAVTAKDPESMAGFHVGHEGTMVILADEASGIPSSFLETLQGALTSGESFTVLTGNPTRTSGDFYEAFNSQREAWYAMRVSAYDCPEQVQPQWIEDMKSMYGEQSTAYRVRVLGEFPLGNDDSLVPLSWMEGALVQSKADMERIQSATDGYSIGVDPARSGKDSSFVIVRQGSLILGDYFAEFEGMATTELCGYLVNLYEKLLLKSPLHPNTAQPIRPVVSVDAIGIGAGVVDNLKEQGINVREVQYSETAPPSSPKCLKMRDWLFWQIRDLFDPENSQDPVILIRNKRSDQAKLVERMIGETSNLTYRFRSSGAVEVESKDDYKKRNNGKSPDAADALAISFAREARVPKARPKRRRSAMPVGWII